MGKKGDSTRQHIHETAAALFAQRGYRDVTMQDICDAVGLSKGGLYRHYDSKEAVFAALLRAMQEEESDAFDQPVPAPLLLDAFLAHIRAELTAPNLNIALCEFCLEHRETVGRDFLTGQFSRGRAALSSLIAAGCAEGVFRAADPIAAAETILLLLEGLKLTAQVMPLPDETVDGVFGQIRTLLGIEVAL